MGVQEVRARLVEQATSRLAPHLPRLQMFGMVLITALAGFLTSFALYRGLGLTHMGIRYPIAMLAAYGVFLFCVWRWVKYQRRKAGIEEEKSNKGHVGDWSFDLPRFGGTGGSGGGGGDFKPGGGAFGGAGAGSSWSSAGTGIAQPEAYSYVSPAANTPTSGGGWFGGGKSGGGGGGFDLDVDDGVAILIVVLIVGAILAALTYVVWAAPSILGEVFVDGVLASTLARGVRDAQTGHWFWTILRKTWWMLLLLLVILGWGGFALQDAFPQAHTLSEVLMLLEQ